MNSENLQKNGVVVTRTINHPTQTNADNEGYYEEMSMIPVISTPSFDGLIGVLGFVEYITLGFILCFGILSILAMVKARGKYKCPNCGKSYCWYKRIPESCRRCGTKLGIPRFNLPK
jgi:predicted RNA-binding Zn-ribbon protein involved in translation (DUF1610 family)